MDLVTDVLTVSGVRGTLGVRIEASGRWCAAFGDHSKVALHAVTGGSAWLTRPGRDPVELTVGDVVMVPADTPHHLGSDPRPSVTPVPAAIDGVLTFGQPPACTRIVTIHYDCDRVARTQVLHVLPEPVHVKAATGRADLDDIVRMIGRELAEPRLATTAVLNSLVDVLLIHLLRAWLPAHSSELRGTWLGLFEDPLVHQALEHLHAAPDKPWTTGGLATAISVSRRPWPGGSPRRSAAAPPPT